MDTEKKIQEYLARGGIINTIPIGVGTLEEDTDSEVYATRYSTEAHLIEELNFHLNLKG